jgi:hypothetical protein
MVFRPVNRFGTKPRLIRDTNPSAARAL